MYSLGYILVNYVPPFPNGLSLLDLGLISPFNVFLVGKGSLSSPFARLPCVGSRKGPGTCSASVLLHFLLGSTARLSSNTGVPFREGQCGSPELGESRRDKREYTQALTQGEPKRPQTPSLLALDLSKPSRLQSGGPHIPFPTSVPSVPFALGPAPDPGNILFFPEPRAPTTASQCDGNLK